MSVWSHTCTIYNSSSEVPTCDASVMTRLVFTCPWQGGKAARICTISVSCLVCFTYVSVTIQIPSRCYCLCCKLLYVKRLFQRFWELMSNLLCGSTWVATTWVATVLTSQCVDHQFPLGDFKYRTVRSAALVTHHALCIEFTLPQVPHTKYMDLGIVAKATAMTLIRYALIHLGAASVTCYSVLKSRVETVG